MNRQDIQKLLGGYATGTLTPEEEQALFAAALEDQQLFDTLMREQPLRDLLRDPAARATLLASLNETPAPWYRRFALPLAAAAALVLIGVPLFVWRAHRPAQPAAIVAQVAPPAPVERALEPAPTPPPPEPKPQIKVSRTAKRQAVSEPGPVAAATQAEPVAPVIAAAPKAAPPPQGDLKPGSTAETVEVTAQPTEMQAKVTAAPSAAAAPVPAMPRVSPTNGFLPMQAGGGGGGSAKAMMARALAAQIARLKYTVLSRQSNGKFAAANPADLHAGDTVELHLESQDTGYVYVAEGKTLLASSPIEAGKPFDAVIEPRGAGERQIECWFSPRQTVWPAADSGSVAGVGGVATTGSLNQHPPAIRITLSYK